VTRIAVVDRTKLRVIDVERSQAVDVGALGDSRLANRQPAWSPDGALLAWSAFDRRQTDSPSALAVATPEGTWRTDHAAVFPPFYLAWRPDGGAIAALAEGPLGLELTVTDARSGTCDIVLRGAPLYFTWSPTGTIAAHCGSGGDGHLEVLGDDYDHAAFAAHRTGEFTAPAFVAGGHVLAVLRTADEAELVVLDHAGAVQRTVGSADFGARFVVDPTGTWVANTSRRGAQGVLVVHNLATDELSFVDDQSPALFAWSPDARHLLFARVAERGDFPLLEWCTWTGGEVRVHSQGRTTATFGREVLPFHEQFARSHSWWSPDSDAFCYAALDDYGNDSIWVARLDRDRPKRLVTGSMAVWAPR
jgi:hypothetical protein